MAVPKPRLALALVLALAAARGEDVLGQDQRADHSSSVMTWLPRELEPQHYRVRIQPRLHDLNFTAPADLEFTFLARASVDRVVVNVRDLAIDEKSVVVEQEGPAGAWSALALARHEYRPLEETYAARLLDPLRPSWQGKGRRALRYRLRMNYTARVGDNLKGLYRIAYLGEDGERRWMALTQLHPTNARAMFPCLDEPQYKARFTLSVARHKDHTSVANMPIRTTEPMAGTGDWLWDHFHTSVPMSSYLIALAVFDFGKLESTATADQPAPPPAATPADAAAGNATTGVPASRDVTFRVWARRGALARGAYAARIGPPVLKYFSRIFNISFPLPKQDMVAAPRLFFYAMENWGLVTFREGALLVDEADAGSRHYVASTVAHELAHQWFGNLVTMRWWNDVWLNEGFATYMSQLGVSHVEPQWRSEGIFVLENMQGVMQRDALPSSHPVSRQVHQVSDIDHIFDDISYKKGSSLVRMMSEFLGAPVFQRGLNAYLRRHAYANAAQDDLWAALTETARRGHALPRDQSVKSIMDSWTLRTGFPVLTVTRDYAAATARIAQKRFLVATDASEPTAPEARGDADCCWGVPLWVKTFPPCGNTTTFGCNGTQELRWLLGAEERLSGLPPGPLLLNGARAGYYRVNYDPANWALLAEALAGLSDLERAGLVDDALALAGAGRLDYGVPLALLQRLPRDRPSLAWVAALQWLAKLSHLLHGSEDSGAGGAFGRWARALAADLLRTSEAVRLSADPVDHAFVARVQAWACGLGVPGCLGPTGIPLDTGAPAARRFGNSDLCGAQKSAEEWSEVLSKYLIENPAFLVKLAECVQSQEAAKRMLELSSQETNDEQLVDDLLQKLTTNPFSYNAVIGFIKTNWTQLQAKFGSIENDIAKHTLPYVKNTTQMIQLEEMLVNLKENAHIMNEGKHNVWWLQHQAEKLLKEVDKLK